MKTEVFEPKDPDEALAKFNIKSLIFQKITEADRQLEKRLEDFQKMMKDQIVRLQILTYTRV